ncbi:MAG: tetraacyldisaccharide 4'-kinase [Planctomycetota bacterium]|jgi:tetraacyldisaccharide 4'-kinase
MAAEQKRLEDRLAKRGGLVELLRLPALVFGALAKLRGRLYDSGRLTAFRLGIPVVCIGNLSVGGTGKTPMVIWITRELVRRGWRPGLLSRGYGKAGEELNDEARELRRVLPEVPHVQNPDRVAGGQALEKEGVDIIVMDDGFQHRRLGRDLDLVLIDATRPWGLPAPSAGVAPVCACLPRGFLREAPIALSRASAILMTRTDQVDRKVLEGLRQEFEELAPGIPIAETIHKPAGLRVVVGDELALEQLSGREVDLFSGIGNPEAFEQTVSELGAKVIEHRRFPDHHSYTASDLVGLGEQRPVLTTAKDIVKCNELYSSLDSLYVLEVELTLVAGDAVVGAMLDSISKGSAAHERDSLHAGLHG